MITLLCLGTLSHVIGYSRGTCRLVDWHVDWHVVCTCTVAAGAASLDVDLANDIVQLAVASGDPGPFQQVLGEYKMVGCAGQCPAPSITTCSIPSR